MLCGRPRCSARASPAAVESAGPPGLRVAAQGSRGPCRCPERVRVCPLFLPLVLRFCCGCVSVPVSVPLSLSLCPIPLSLFLCPHPTVLVSVPILLSLCSHPSVPVPVPLSLPSLSPALGLPCAPRCMEPRCSSVCTLSSHPAPPGALLCRPSSCGCALDGGGSPSPPTPLRLGLQRLLSVLISCIFCVE